MDGVYISFSGGKDSTVLLDICRNLYPSMKAMFINTPTQYPELLQFAKTFENVDIVNPKYGFLQVCEKYGYPFFSKEVSQQIWEIRHVKTEKTVNKRLYGVNGSRTGMLPYKYRFAALNEDGKEFSNACCKIMKKNPAHQYEKRTVRKSILGIMAEESTIRRQKWIQNGCNSFDIKRPSSSPMSFWIEQDVLEYIYTRKLPICSVYGDVILDIKNQYQYSMFDEQKNKYKTTGCDRTGCIACGFGCQFKKDDRFVRLKQSHPNFYEWLMKPKENGGLGYKELIDWINEHGNLNIKY